MKTQNIVLIGLIGAAIYYFYKKSKSSTTPTGGGAMKSPEGSLAVVDYAPGGDKHILALPGSMTPMNDLGLPAAVNERTGQGIEQTLDANGNPVNTAYQVRFAIKGIPNII
jgi:hypothetical protein